MSSEYEEVPGTDVTPAGFHWSLCWPPAKPSGPGGIVVAVLLTAAFAGVTLLSIAAHSDGAPAGMIVMFGAFTLCIPLMMFVGRNPVRIERIEGGVAVLRVPLKQPSFLIGVPTLLAVGIGILMIGLEVHAIVFTVFGAAMTALAAFVGVAGLANRRPLILTNDRLKCGDSLSVDWQEIRVLRAKTTAGRSPQPYVSFRRADPTTYSGASDKRITVTPGVWSLDPNGLISLIEFMVENPSVRAGVTPAQFEAMLAGPPRPSGKWWD
ncbi:hypothetical protein ACFXHA_41960 [Nocardia sp. NPDC059240]|uniref:hypothetical protein n=1 Tax=Nocardia sp. NPDC059240 TaxID=3346786 RepID=UPI00367517DC